MHTCDEYLATAKELKNILDKVHTVNDVIKLGKVGIPEAYINSIDLGYGFIDDDISNKLYEVDGDTKIKGIHIDGYAKNGAAIDDIIYCNIFGDGTQASMTFDISDGDEVILESVSIETLTENYYNYCLIEEYALEVFDKSSLDFLYQVDVFLTETEAIAYAKARPLASPNHDVYGITTIHRNGNEDEIGRETYYLEEDEDPTNFYKVKVLNGFKTELSEVCEHLTMNGYTYDTNGEDSIFIYEEEIGYLKTILKDRNLKFEVM